MLSCLYLLPFFLFFALFQEILIDPSETLQEREIPSLCRHGTCISFFISFFLFKFIAITQVHFPAGLLPSDSFSPGNRFFAFSILTLDFGCLLLKLHLLMSGLLGLGQHLRASFEGSRGERQEYVLCPNSGMGNFVYKP